MLRLALAALALAAMLAYATPDLARHVTALIGTGTPPAPPAAAAAPATVVLRADRAGHYRTEISVNGRALPVLVDTGATMVALRYEDARRLGLVRADERFDVAVQTANGTARAKRVQLSSVRLGGLVVHDVNALVTQPGMLGENLLGMSFLGRLRRMEAAAGRLALEN